jgi:hypothetical protein
LKKIIFAMVVAVATAAIVLPLAVAGPSPAHANGNVTWKFHDDPNGTDYTGTVIFNANEKTGGSLDYQNNTGQWLHGVVDNYKQINANTVVFTGTITAGSDDYLPGTGHFYAKVVDGGSSGVQGDKIAVLANAGPQSVNDPLYDGPMGDVSGGNLSLH